MKLGSVAVLGGGPGGLYLARLLKLRDPTCTVDVHEQSTPGRTFGFGVGLAVRTQRNLAAADPVTHADIVESSWRHDMSMRVGGHRAVVPQESLVAIGRSTLLELLHRRAVEVGVQVHHGSRVTAAELEADLVVAADGVSSATRDALSAELGASVTTEMDYYLWCGTETALPNAVFTPAETEYGTFVAHAYPYAHDRSTFLIETDPETWKRAGFESTTHGTLFEESDEEALAYLTSVFAEELRGHPLIGNRTRWSQFRTVSCRRWHVGNTVLLGDAAHTAHYSIGSGTKLAMEDAIALDRLVDQAGTLDEAVERYELERRPAVEHLQETAERSMRWWRTFPDRLDLPVEQLFVSFMSRAGKVSVDRFVDLAPDIARQGAAQYAGTDVGDVPTEDLGQWVMARPFESPRWRCSSRVLTSCEEVRIVPLGGQALDDSGTAPVLVHVEMIPENAENPAADSLVLAVTDAQERGATGALLETQDDLGSVLDALDLGERLRREAGAVVVIRAAERWAEHLAAGLASGRADLVDLTSTHDEAA